MVGDNKPYGSVASCPNNNPKAKFNLFSNYVAATATTWAYHTCMNFRTSLDTYTYVQSNGIGQNITFLAGYDIFASANTGAQLSQGTMSQSITYTIKDLAVALTASLAVSASILSLGF